jgi:hypothetical protein
MAVAGVVLGIGGCAGFLTTMESTWDVPGMVLAAVFVVGAAVVIGAVELFLIGIARLMLKRPGAR